MSNGNGDRRKDADRRRNNDEFRNRSSNNSRMSRNKPKSLNEVEISLKNHYNSIENTKDEGIQMSQVVSDDDKPGTNDTKDVGVQFTFEDRENRKSDGSKIDLENDIKEQDDDNDNIAINQKKTNEKKDPPLYIFADEQGAGQLRAASEMEKSKNQDSENTTEDAYKNSFGSRKTSLSKPMNYNDS